MKISKPLPVIALIAILSLSVAAQEPVAAPRHNEGGMTGPNGVEQEVAIKINKQKQGKDIAYIQVDLGDQRFDSNTPWVVSAWRISITLGSVPEITGLTDAKGRIQTSALKCKVIKNGAGLLITMNKATLANLLSDFSGNTGHGAVPLIITADQLHTINGRLLPVPTSTLFSQTIHFDITENTRVLFARGG